MSFAETFLSPKNAKAEADHNYLIDEVIGEERLPSFRLVSEYTLPLKAKDEEVEYVERLLGQKR